VPPAVPAGRAILAAVRFLTVAAKVVIAAVILAVGVPLLTGGTVLASFIFLPLPATLPAARVSQVSAPSVVYDDQGNVIATFQESGLNLPVAAKDIPKIVEEALISSEDHNFFHEGGISVRGTLRALYDDLVHGQVVQGGSTITQQYVKNAYTGNQRTVLRKIHEAILAGEVSRQLSKSQILYRYLSTSYFGEGSYGVGAAAQTYFRTPVQHLDASQAATLVGVLPAPTAYDPLVNLADAEARRETVLGLMEKYGYLNQAQYSQAMAERLTLAPDVKANIPVTAVYGPEQASNAKYPYFIDYLKQYLETRIGYQELYGGGLQIQSTLDPNDEAQAGAAVGRTLQGTSPPVDMALVSVEPATGYVKALIGGRDYQASQVNLALGGCPLHPPATDNVEVPPACWSDPDFVGGGGYGFQAGSSFKVFTLATALEQGVSPDSVYPGPTNITIGGQNFHNDEGEGGGDYTLREATWLSINTVYVQVANQVGIKNYITTAQNMGISSAWFDPRIHGLSTTLGVEDVSPLDMASAYGVLADQGMRMQPTPVVKVVDGAGKTLIDNTRPAGTRVLPATIASTETQILQGVPSHGTGYPNAVINRPEAGKTGTTDNCVDAWYVGYTPQLSTSVWMGHLSGETPLRGIYSRGTYVPCVYGGTLPAMTWADYMNNALKNVPVADFAQPPAPVAPPSVFISTPQGLAAGSESYPAPLYSTATTFISQPPPPYATAPTTTTTTTYPSATTTTTSPASPTSTSTSTTLIPPNNGPPQRPPPPGSG
jgi:penicillin-binding protein 1A